MDFADVFFVFSADWDVKKRMASNVAIASAWREINHTRLRNHEYNRVDERTLLCLMLVRLGEIALSYVIGQAKTYA